MLLNFFSILTIISIFITTLLTVFFFVTRRGFVPETRLLALLLLVFNLQIFYSCTTSFFASEYFMPWHKPLFMIRQVSFLVGPLIWLYVNAFRKRKEIFRYESTLHFLPFAVSWMFLLIYFRGIERFVIWESIIDFFTTILILIHTVLYLVFSLRCLNPEKPGMKKFFAGLLSAPNNRWLRMLLLGFILLWIVNLNSFALYMIIRRPGWCAYTESIYALTAFLFITAIILVLLLRPDACYFVTKYKNTKLSDRDKEEYLRRLNEYMESRKPCLDPDITIEFLAGEISVSPRPHVRPST